MNPDGAPTQDPPAGQAGAPAAAPAHVAAFAESAAVALVGTDADFVIRLWNPAAAALFGYGADETIGRSLLTLVPADEHAAVLRLLARARAGEPVAPYVAVRVRKDGSPIHLSVIPWRVQGPAGEFLGVGVAYIDRAGQEKAEGEARRLQADRNGRVVELARTSEALRESEARFRLLVESATDYAIFMLDPDGLVVSWSSGAERIKGYRPEEIIGRHFSAFYPPDAVERGWPRWELESAAATGRFEDEGWRVRKDGSRFWANVVITAVRDETGRLLGYGKVSRDLSERKRAEDEIRGLNADLEDRVRARTAELEAANRDLSQKNAENEMFVYSVSHDLRSPLVNLQGFSKELEKACRGLADLLAGETVPPDVRDRGRAILDGKAAKSIGFIQSAVTRLATIIDALLRLSRAGRVDYRWEAVDVAQVVAQVVRAAALTVSQRGATVRVGDLPPAWGDRTAVEQVFANLIGNALTYLDPARPGVIEVGALDAGPDEGMRTYFVRDNGLGIAEGHRQKIFQAFQRAHPGVGSGEGLGLAIVTRVVERHRGRVWVESRAGEGSTFYVTLPAPRGGPEPTARSRPCPTAS